MWLFLPPHTLPVPVSSLPVWLLILASTLRRSTDHPSDSDLWLLDSVPVSSRALRKALSSLPPLFLGESWDGQRACWPSVAK